MSTWTYPSTKAIDYDQKNHVLFIGSENRIIIQLADDPVNIEIISTIPLKANIADFFYHNNHLFISNEDKGFWVYDVTNLKYPRKIMNISMCWASKLFHYGAYTGIIMPCTFSDDNNNLSIMNIASPRSIYEVNRVNLSGLSEILDLYIDNNLVFAIDFVEGINVFNFNEILDPKNNEIQMFGVYDRPGKPNHIIVRNKLAYVSDFDSGFCIIDYSNPESPLELSCEEEIECAVGSILVDNHAFVATHDMNKDKDNYLWALDIQDPENVTVLEKVKLKTPASNIFYANKNVYVAGYEKIYVYQCIQDYPIPQFYTRTMEGIAPLTVSYTNTTSGTFIASKWDFGDGYSSKEKNPIHTYKNAGQYSVSLAVSDGNQCYSEIKLNYITVKDPPPVADFVSDVQSGASPLSVHFKQLSKGHITSALWDFGDETTSTDLNPVHKYTQTGLFSVRLTVSGPGGSNTTFIKDYITVKNNVIELNQWNDKPVSTVCIDKERFIAFLATPTGIDILNFTNPVDIKAIDIISLDIPAESLFYNNNQLFVACGTDGLRIFDVTIPGNSKAIAHVPLRGFSNHVWVSNETAFVSTISFGVEMIHLPSDRPPEVMESIHVAGEAYVTKINDYGAFIAEGEAGIFLYKQIGAHDFTEHSFFEVNGEVSQFEFTPKGLFVASKEAGLIILDIEMPSNEMIKIGDSFDTMPALDVFVHNDYAFVACGPEGLKILDVTHVDEPIETKSFPSNDSSVKMADAYPYLCLADGIGGLRIFAQPEQNQLTLKIPQSIQNDDKVLGTVCLPFVFDKDVIIHLSSNYTHSVSIPESVIIPSGQLCQEFTFFLKNSQLQDDDEIIVYATADGWLGASSKIIKEIDTYKKEYFLPNLPIIIPDKSEIRELITIGDIGQIHKISIKLDIENRHISDIQAQLISPQNEKITLFSRINIIEMTNRTDFELTDEAEACITNAKPPIGGKYRPQEPLSILKGRDIKGTWTLIMTDFKPSDATTIHNWSMVCELVNYKNSPPEAYTDASETDRRSSVSIPVLDNDYDPNGDILSIIGFTTPQKGKIQFNSNKKEIVYIPDPTILRAISDTFQYSISDGKETDQSTVTVYVSDFFICSETPIPITQISPDGLTAKIDIPSSSATIQDVNVLLSIQHPHLNNLTVSLKAPDSNHVILFDNIGVDNNHIDNIIFNDEASQDIDHNCSILSGPFKPLEPLNLFDGQKLSGEWLLTIKDLHNKGSGLLVSFELQIFYSEDPHKFVEKIDDSQRSHQLFFHPKKHINTIQHNAFAKPDIHFLEIPQIGNRIKPLKGYIHNADSRSNYLLIYVYTDEWHIKPRIETPLTPIMKDGSWQCDITTKPDDEKASKIAIFMFVEPKIPLLFERLPVLPESYFQKSISYEIINKRPNVE